MTETSEGSIRSKQSEASLSTDTRARRVEYAMSVLNSSLRARDAGRAPC